MVNNGHDDDLWWYDTDADADTGCIADADAGSNADAGRNADTDTGSNTDADTGWWESGWNDRYFGPTALSSGCLGSGNLRY
jgi:hypothetical protein